MSRGRVLFVTVATLAALLVPSAPASPGPAPGAGVVQVTVTFNVTNGWGQALNVSLPDRAGNRVTDVNPNSRVSTTHIVSGGRPGESYSFEVAVGECKARLLVTMGGMTRDGLAAGAKGSANPETINAAGYVCRISVYPHITLHPDSGWSNRVDFTVSVEPAAP